VTAIAPGVHPFWFWNAALSAEEIRWQVAEMAAQGIRGFFIHPRQGLAVPYLSERFFEMVTVAVEAAAAHDLQVHIYDEYPYPSGAAGGAVTLGDPRFHATRLRQSVHDVPGGPVRLALARGKLLDCRAFPLDGGAPDWSRPVDLNAQVGMVLAEDSYVRTGLTAYNRKRYFASSPRPVLEAQLPTGAHRIFVSVQEAPDHDKYWGHHPDAMNPEAVRRFLELTHERYRAKLGAHFGKTIRSVFVDETAVNWSERLPGEFGREYGYDLRAELHALQDPAHPRHLRVAVDLERLKYRLFCESFEKPVAEWCRRHGLAYTGEKPSMRLAQLGFMDLPGCEPGHTKAGAATDVFGALVRGNARATASAAYFHGKTGALCECWHSMGWAATLQDARLIADELLLAGVDRLVPHGFFYSTHGLRKHDAPPSFFFQMPVWRFFGHLARRVERIARELAGTRIDAGVLVVEPASGLPAKPDLDAYTRLQQLLLARHFDFLMVDTDILESGRVKGGRVRIRDVEAALIVVPPMPFIEPKLAEWLSAFERAGGRVLRLSRDFDAETLAAELRKSAEPALELSARGGGAERVFVTRRVGAGRKLWLVVNTGSEPVRLALLPGCPVKEVPVEEGGAPASLRSTSSGQALDLRPFESILLEACDGARLPPCPPTVKLALAGPARVLPLNRNLLRMYDWRMSLLDESGAEIESHHVPAVPLADQLADGGFRFAPRFERFFGHAPELRLPEFRVRYAFEFESSFAGPVELVMEPGSIIGDWELEVNGGAPLKGSDFAPTGSHVRGSLGADITGRLRSGRNRIAVAVRTDRLDGGLLNALYLAGDFGVEVNPPALVVRSPLGAFERHEENGLPFYAGTVEYELSRELAELPAGPSVVAELDGGAGFQEACEVSVNGGPWRPVLWEPRRILLERLELRAGENQLRVRVSTTLARAFEGQWFDSVRHAYREVGEGTSA
jgi:hypothetical protein